VLPAPDRHECLCYHVGSMKTLTIRVSEEKLAQLRDFAARLGISPEDLARAGVDDLLARPAEAFEQAVEYVVHKNADLYRRLA